MLKVTPLRAIAIGFLIVLLGAGAYFVLNSDVVESRSSDTSDRITLQFMPPPDFDTAILDGFEAQNPTISVEAATLGRPRALDRLDSTEMAAHLDAHREYLSEGDVVYIEDRHLNAEAMLTDYYLDMAPLVNSDTDLDTTRFQSGLWQAFQADNARYGFPVAGRVMGLQYDSERLEAMGLPLPDDTTTPNDFLRLIESIYAEQTDKAQPVLFTASYADEILSLLVEAVPQGAPLQTPPDFTQPTTEAIVERWATLVEAGAIVEGVTDGYSIQDVPLQIGTAGNTYEMRASEIWSHRFTTLPGGVTLPAAKGFAINSATQQPQAAYRLIKYLNERAPELFIPLNVDIFTLEQHNDPQENPTRDNRFQAQIRADAESLMPAIETRYHHYLWQTLRDATTDGSPDAETIITDAQAAADAGIDEALSRRDDSAQIAAAPATPIPGQDVLVFGGMDYLLDVNAPAYDDLVENFVLNDDSIGGVDLITDNSDPLGLYTNEADCFYHPTSLAHYPGDADFVDLLPLLQADTTLAEDDLFAAIANLLQDETTLYGYPVLAAPSVIVADETRIGNSTSPTLGWDDTAFQQVVSELESSGADVPIFAPSRLSPVYILALAAAEDALPYDTRSTPPTLALTDSDTVEGLRVILDMAQAGAIDYQPLTERGVNAQNDTVLQEQPWQMFEFRRLVTERDDAGLLPDEYRLTLYPQGTQYAPLILDVGAVYINAQSALTDECYRWAQYLAANAHRFYGGMSTRSTSLAQVENTRDAALFSAVVDRLQSQKRLLLPLPDRPMSVTRYAEFYWLGAAFDAYVLNDANLAEALQTAETRIRDFRACEQQLSADVAPSEIITCAAEVDPDAAAYLQERS